MTVQSVPFLSIAGMAMTLAVSIALPILLYFYFRRKLEVKTSSLLFGAIIYYIAAKIFEPFINAAILNNIGGSMMNNVFVYAAYVGIIATAVEEGTRYLGLKTIVKNVDEANALFFGLGFCGLEAILIAAWPQLSNILNSLLINNGMMAQSLASLQEPELSNTYFVIAPLWQTPSAAFLLAAVERALTIVMHLCLSLVMLYYIKTEDKKCLWLAVGGHFAVVACSALLNLKNVPLFSVITTAAVTAALVVFTHRKREEYLATSVPLVMEAAESSEEDAQ